MVFIIILKLFFRIKVEGAENLPQKTNFIVASNHSSYLDPLFLGGVIQKKIYWIILREFYRRSWLKWFMSLTEALPEGGSSKKFIYLLMKNKNVGLFPEGTRTHNGKLREFKRGAALFSIRTGRPVVPCAILGSYEVFPRTAKFPKLFRSIKVRIGKPIYLLKEFEDVIDDIRLQEGTFKIRNAIEKMINENYPVPADVG